MAGVWEGGQTFRQHQLTLLRFPRQARGRREFTYPSQSFLQCLVCDQPHTLVPMPAGRGHPCADSLREDQRHVVHGFLRPSGELLLGIGR